jgi:hypothetical protein
VVTVGFYNVVHKDVVKPSFTAWRDLPYHSPIVYTQPVNATPPTVRKSCSNKMDNPVRKRRRPAVACTECRRRKVKCDRSLPCASCVLGTLSCAYNTPDIPLLQNPGPLAAFATNSHTDWHLLSSFPTSNSDYQRLYGNGIESSEAPILSLFDANNHVPDNFSTIRHQASIIDPSAEGSSSVSRPLDATATCSSSLNIQNMPKSTKSSLSRGTHLTPNNWKNVFKEVCVVYHHLARFM